MNLTQEVLRELLEYDPETGDMTWRKRDGRFSNSDRDWSRWNARFAGKRAGWINTNDNGYRCVKIGLLNVDYYAHRLAWLYVNGEPIPKELDHLDRDATNNAWSNLRSVTRTENMLNQSRYRNNTSGRTGVSWVGRDKKWHAFICMDGKQWSLGNHDTIIDAVSERIRAERQYGFEPGHGQIAPYRRKKDGQPLERSPHG